MKSPRRFQTEGHRIHGTEDPECDRLTDTVPRQHHHRVKYAAPIRDRCGLKHDVVHWRPDRLEPISDDEFEALPKEFQPQHRDLHTCRK